MRIAIHVRPRSATAEVGGDHDGALVVCVTEPPDRGRATEAARRAVAGALEVPRDSVTLVTGATSRRKVLDVEVAEQQAPALAEKLQRLRRRADDT